MFPLFFPSWLQVSCVFKLCFPSSGLLGSFICNYTGASMLMWAYKWIIRINTSLCSGKCGWKGYGGKTSVTRVSRMFDSASFVERYRGRSLYLIKKILCGLFIVCLFLSVCVYGYNGIIEVLGVSGAPEPGPTASGRAEQCRVGSGVQSVLFKRSSENRNMNLEAIQGGRLSNCHYLPIHFTQTIKAAWLWPADMISYHCQFGQQSRSLGTEEVCDAKLLGFFLSESTDWTTSKKSQKKKWLLSGFDFYRQRVITEWISVTQGSSFSEK